MLDPKQEKLFKAFETSKITEKFLFAVLKHTSSCKNCTHNIREVLAEILVEKVEEYMIGEDLVGAQDKQLAESVNSADKDNERDNDSLSLEEAEENARIKDGSMFEVAMFRNVKGSQEIWNVIRKHIDEGENDGKNKCTHRLIEILYDIPMVKELSKQL